MQFTASSCSKNTRTHSPRCTSHNLHERSVEPVARYSELGWKRKHCEGLRQRGRRLNRFAPLTSTSPRCPAYMRTGAVRSVIHSLAVRSRLAVAK